MTTTKKKQPLTKKKPTKKKAPARKRKTPTKNKSPKKEALTVEQMKPVEFQPILSRSFLCESPDVEAYEVSDVVDSSRLGNRIQITAYATEDNVASLSALRAKAEANREYLFNTDNALWFKPKPTQAAPITIKFLDPTGAVLHTEVYKECRLIDVCTSGLSYDTDEPLQLFLTYAYKS